MKRTLLDKSVHHDDDSFSESINDYAKHPKSGEKHIN